jgi:hypothetical protein
VGHTKHIQFIDIKTDSTFQESDNDGIYWGVKRKICKRDPKGMIADGNMLFCLGREVFTQRTTGEKPWRLPCRRFVRR